MIAEAGMAIGRYRSPASVIEFATEFAVELNAVIRTRMLRLGVSVEMIGMRGVPGIDEGHAFVRFPETQIGGNLNPTVNPRLSRGIALDHGVLDVLHPSMSNVPAWGSVITTLRDRVDAAIVHEYLEATLTPPASLIGLERVEWLHNEAIRRSAETTMPITEMAREILVQYRRVSGLGN